ncbi:MAG: alcohol dehydrogenase catalytic domain-containing protein [Candidatus Atribacteria bacterium]|nr:alcohol dehydrogenase catalytic domain-containing protein [Candidatus Atribacteria bacterium]
MISAVLEDVGKLVIKEFPVPQPKEDTVLVHVKACGICLTDYKAYSGARTNLNYPAILGHEFTGVIEKVGERVRFFKEGDAVIVSPVIGCGMCKNCRNGFPHYCKNGAVIGGDGMDRIIDGAFSEYVLIPESCLYHKPDNISFEAAALTEPLAGSYKGLIEYSQMKIGEDVVIIGAGSMGLLVTMIASRAGAGTLILVDVNDWRLELSKKCGATHTINSHSENAIKAVYDIIPEGPDLVFEAAGPLEAAELAFNLCRRGTRINEFGVTTKGTIPVSPLDIHFQETRVDASFTVTPWAVQKSILLMEKGLVDPTRIITHSFRLKDINEAMETMKISERVKIIIKM